MATQSKTGIALREIHKDVKKLYTRLEKLKLKIPVKEREPVESASLHLRAAGIKLATKF